MDQVAIHGRGQGFALSAQDVYAETEQEAKAP